MEPLPQRKPRRVKPLLYVYRVLLTGISLMRTGEIQANLVTLNGSFNLPYLHDLIARKLSGHEKSKLADSDLALHESEYQRLRTELLSAAKTLAFLNAPTIKPAPPSTTFSSTSAPAFHFETC